MKIKTDFVTNSSSTNFIIISKKEINSSEDLVEVLGINKDSPIYSYINEFCMEVLTNTDKNYFGVKDLDEEKEFIKKEFGLKTFRKYSKLTRKGYKVYIGRADTEFNELMNFFAMDYFEIDNKDLFIDGRKNVFWF